MNIERKRPTSGIATRGRCALLLAALLAGCAGPGAQLIEGKRAFRDHWREALAPRASGELGCPKEAVRMGVLASVKDRDVGELPSQVSVEGCGRRAVYVQVVGVGWVLNSEGDRAR